MNAPISSRLTVVLALALLLPLAGCGKKPNFPVAEPRAKGAVYPNPELDPQPQQKGPEQKKAPEKKSEGAGT